MRVELGKAIKQLRTERKWNQETLAEKINVDKGNISRYESGKQSPELDKIVMLANAFDVEVWELFAKAQGVNVDNLGFKKLQAEFTINEFKQFTEFFQKVEQLKQDSKLNNQHLKMITLTFEKPIFELMNAVSK